MGSCCSKQEEEPVDPAYPHGKPIQHDPNWEGPVKKRSCTDIICLLLFLVLLGAWGFVAVLAFQEGDVNKVKNLSIFNKKSRFIFYLICIKKQNKTKKSCYVGSIQLVFFSGITEISVIPEKRSIL